jgi:cyclopropane-fatty-acyl-phospholipid synthase
MVILKSVLKRVVENTKIPFEVVFSDGTSIKNKAAHEQPAKFKIVYKTKGAELQTMLLIGTGICRGYVNGTIDLEGDVSLASEISGDLGGPLKNVFPKWLTLEGWYARYLSWKDAGTTVERARRNAMFHYERGTDMFAQYLDPTMMYTCAYWKEGTKTLEEAQRNKIEHVCRKLRLKEGETLVDVGSGWGEMLIHAAKRYGVKGVSYSVVPDQNKSLKERIARAGVSDMVEVVDGDYREVRGTFDKYVSIGVYEHAGEGQLEGWVRAMSACLKPGGVGLLHWIGTEQRLGAMSVHPFMQEFVFPGAYLASVGETVELMNKHGLETLDVENLRRHYALTLAEWGKNFDTHWKTIHALDPQKFNEKFRRAWRLYLLSCANSFKSQHTTLRLWQVTFSKGMTTTYPMSRAFLYE